MEKLIKKLNKCIGFLFYPSDEEDSPNICGFLFSNPNDGRDVFSYVASKRTDGFIKMTIKYSKDRINIRILNSKDEYIIHANGIFINEAALKSFKKSFSENPNQSIGVMIFYNSDGLKIYPISQDEPNLTLKGFTILES